MESYKIESQAWAWLQRVAFHCWRGRAIVLSIVLLAGTAACVRLPPVVQAPDCQQVVGLSAIAITCPQPIVTQRMTSYSSVKFEAGDRIRVEAGGCVNIGGFPAYVKHYVEPRGGDAFRLYRGLIWVPGATEGPVPLKSVLGRTLTVAAGYPGDMYLRLGYEDDNYSDNSYTWKDASVQTECDQGVGKASEPAWVSLTIERAGASPDQPTVPQPRPLDLQIADRDANWLPLNPKFPGPHPDATAPHPCAGFPLVFNTADDPSSGLRGVKFVLGEPPNNPCTTQPISIDLPKYDLFSEILHKTCILGEIFVEHRPRALYGHVNWFPATYTGTVGLAVENVDGDYELELMRDDAAGLTTGNNGKLGLEFSSYEVAPYFANGWWKKFRDALNQFSNAWEAVDGGPSDIPSPVVFDEEQFLQDQVVGRFAIVSGLFNLDCEHDCHTELHPVWALALSTGDDPDAQAWAMFVRNWGNQGWCSNSYFSPYSHYLDLREDSAKKHLYTFQLPWARNNATDYKITKMQFWNERGVQLDAKEVTIQKKPGQAVYVTLPLPAPPDTGIGSIVYGELHLQWLDAQGRVVASGGALGGVSAVRALEEAKRRSEVKRAQRARLKAVLERAGKTRVPVVPSAEFKVREYQRRLTALCAAGEPQEEKGCEVVDQVGEAVETILRRLSSFPAPRRSPSVD